MKIVFLGNFGVDFSSESHHKKSLEALGHTVIPLQEGVARSDEVKREAMQADMFVWVHTHGWFTRGTIPMNVVLNQLKIRNIPTVTYHLDLWLGLRRQNDLRSDHIYRYIEHFFTVDKQMADWFNGNTNVNGHYLTAAVFDEESYMAKPTDFVNEVVFVGSKNYHPEWQYRPRLVSWLEQTYGNRFRHYGGDGLGIVRGHNLNQLYADSKVVVGDSLCLNFDYPYYWSDRVYETLGRGGFIIHPYVKGLENDFKINGPLPIASPAHEIELVTYQYGNFEQLKELIDYYLTHDEEREAIRKRGFERVKKDHTYTKRWEHIIEVAKYGKR